MALEINAQFKQFVQFARQQANPATSEAIARVTGTEDALAGRSISASNTDHTSAACSTDVMKLEGAESFISFDIDNGPFDISPVLVGNSYYTLEVSGDGKSAKITSESKSLLTFGFPESLNGRNFPVGSVSWRSGKQDLLAEIAPGLGTKEAAGRSPRDRRRLAALEAM